MVRLNAPKNSQCLIWLENTVKMCLLLTISSPESFAESGAHDLKNDLGFFCGHSRNNFVVTFEYELRCLNRKSSSIDILKLKLLSTRA